jgi:hypothetical protein
MLIRSFYALRTVLLIHGLSLALRPSLVLANDPCLASTEGGVLISGQAKNFSCYISLLLKQNMPYVILVAVVLVVISGVQYMLAMGNSSEQGKAKQRIVGTLIGIIFYTLISYILPLISGGLSI